MLKWQQDRSGYFIARTRTGKEVAEISPRTLNQRIVWKVFGAKSGTAATINFAQRQAEEAYQAQCQP